MQIINPRSFGMSEDQLMYQNGYVCGFTKFSDTSKSIHSQFSFGSDLSIFNCIIDSNPIIRVTCRPALKDEVYLKMAKEISRLGTCQRMQAGCLLLTLEGRVAGAGYNGAGPGMAHCQPETCNSSHRCYRCAHAEQNSLSHRNGTPYIAYITHEPCLNCARELILAGVKVIKFEKPYVSISDEERKARQEWIDHYKVGWVKL